MARLLEYITNDDGRLSRTQTWLAVISITTLILTILHVIYGGVLDTPVLLVLLGSYIFAYLDRLNAKKIFIDVSRSGAKVDIEAGGNTDAHMANNSMAMDNRQDSVASSDTCSRCRVDGA